MTSEQGSSISVGQELRRAREVRHVTLAQLAAETRIALRHLEALEADRLHDLPGLLYARNFVRQVARSLGADEQELLDYFDYQTGAASRAAAQSDEGVRAGGPSKRHLAFGALAVAALGIAAVLGFALTRPESADPPKPSEAGRVSGDEGSAGSRSPSPAVSPDAVRAMTPGRPEASPEGGAAAVQRAEATGGKPTVAPDGPESHPAQPATGQVSPTPSQPQPTSGEAKPSSSEIGKPETPAATPEAKPPEAKPPEAKPPAAVAVAEPSPVPVATATPSAAPAPPRVRLVFSGPSWIEVVPEGPGQQIMGLKTAGQELSFALDSAVELTIANAGSVELWLDGKPARALGAPGERRTLRLDAHNWRSYLR